MVEDLLYQLCVEVNPQLDIHEVQAARSDRGRARSDLATDARRPRTLGGHGKGAEHEGL